MTAHGFVKALKGYARRDSVWGTSTCTRTWHTAALSEVQAVLGHQSLATTRVYLERVAVKRDKYSRAIADGLGLDHEEPI